MFRPNNHHYVNIFQHCTTNGSNPLAFNIRPFHFHPADDKPVIVVVLHHTFDPEYRDYRGPGIQEDASHPRSVDVLFHDDHLLPCSQNERALEEVLKMVRSRPFWVNQQCSLSASPMCLKSYDMLVIHL